MELMILFSVPFVIELVFPKKILVRVCLMITTAVKIFEGVGAWFILLGFQSGRVSFTVHFIVPSKVLMVIRFVRAITLNIFGSFDPA